MMMKTFLIIVRGKVQGVYFRQSTKETARELGITGTVKNDLDGSVKIVATGEEDQLQQLVKWCYKGPSRAIVSNVEVNETALMLFQGFRIESMD